MKQIFCFLFLFSGACSNSTPENGNTAIARKLFDAFNRHDWSEMASYYIENAEFLDPSFGKEYVKKMKRETADKYRGYEKTFPDIHDEVLGMYPSGDKVIVEFISTGTSGDSLSFRLPIISVLTFRDGLIARDATYYDTR